MNWNYGKQFLYKWVILTTRSDRPGLKGITDENINPHFQVQFLTFTSNGGRRIDNLFDEPGKKIGSRSHYETCKTGKWNI